MTVIKRTISLVNSNHTLILAMSVGTAMAN